ncbi:Alpha/Beta hydrolase protein [Xylariaceae sp. FL1019]|nr:Alpha/Beta hydrolase protein [Xylariaceae sp. FL1019]
MVLLGSLARALAVAVLLELSTAACTGTPYVSLKQGVVKGSRDTRGNPVFLGIPYAATTGGENRWKAPQDVAKSCKQIDATAYGPTCPQAIANSYYTRQDEDCLNVNVWAPKQAYKRPVFVYMYGGAMVTGSSSNPLFQGNNFAENDVLFVSFNTRESLWASPYSSELGSDGESQNFSILDVEKALEWIHDNIEAFGGDSDHIVFGGHSSGSVQVDHYLWNHPDTWLKGAVQMSANAKSGPAYAPVNIALDVVAAEVGCGTGAGQLDCLRKVDFLDFQTTNFNSSYNTWFTPVIDDITRFSDYTARFEAGNYPSHVPLLTGNSDGEGTIFSIVYAAEDTPFSSWINTFDADVAHIPDDVLLNAYNASDFDSEALMSGTLYGDARFDCAVDYLLNMRSEKQDTWVYRFFGKYDNVVGVDGTAPTHGTEIPFFLGGNECFDTLSNVTAAQQALADEMHSWFVSWIKDPSSGLPWNKVQPHNGTVAKLGVPNDQLSIIPASTSDYNKRCRQVYNPAFPRYPVVQSPL